MTLSNEEIIQQLREHRASNTRLGINFMERGIDLLLGEIDRLKSQLGEPAMVITGLPKLARRQAEALEILVEHIDKHGYAPTNRELMKMMGLASPSTVHGMLSELEKKGYIKYIGPRAYQIIARESVVE